MILVYFEKCVLGNNNEELDNLKQVTYTSLFQEITD